MRSGLFTFWFLVTCSDAIGAALAVALLYRLGTRFSRFLAATMACVAVEAMVAALSLLLFWPNEVEMAPAFAIFRASGRTVKSLGVWCLVLFLFNFCDSIHKTVTSDRP